MLMFHASSEDTRKQNKRIPTPHSFFFFPLFRRLTDVNNTVKSLSILAPTTGTGQRSRDDSRADFSSFFYSNRKPQTLLARKGRIGAALDEKKPAPGIRLLPGRASARAQAW